MSKPILIMRAPYNTGQTVGIPEIEKDYHLFTIISDRYKEVEFEMMPPGKLGHPHITGPDIKDKFEIFLEVVNKEFHINNPNDAVDIRAFMFFLHTTNEIFDSFNYKSSVYDNVKQFYDKRKIEITLNDGRTFNLKNNERVNECYFTPCKKTTSQTICDNCGQEKMLHTIVKILDS